MNNIFVKARIKLTVMYLLIVMVISIFFSLTIYTIMDRELIRGTRIMRMIPRPELLQEIRDRIIGQLVLTNLGILVLSGVAGYFLAGRTLKPIQEMLDEQNRFISDASHELRTPLTSLKSEIEVNLRDKKLKLGEVKKLLKSNLEEVNNLQILSDGLIKLTQYKENNNLTEKVSLKEISKKAIEKVKKLAKNKKIEIKENVDEIEVKGNTNALTEMFIIFLDNAIKYSPEKTGIKINAKKLDGRVEIKIEDQGVGIDEKDLPHIFDRFYRADESRNKSKVGGYGLGLAIAKQIIEQHKGMVKVKSKVGKGTIISVII